MWTKWSPTAKYLWKRHRSTRAKPPYQCVGLTSTKAIVIALIIAPRLLAREINTKKRGDLVAATPQFEALKIISALTTSGNKGEMIMVNDISRAFFHAPAKRRVYVQLPDQDCQEGQQRLCWRQNLAIYGTRDAAQNWFIAYSQQLVRIGFEQGKASPCIFHHKTRSIRTLVHGDDYVSVGPPKQLKWLEEQLKSKYQIKTQVLGPDADQAREIKILNRIISWQGSKGIIYEADPRHVEIILEQLGLKDSKEVITPGTREEGITQQDSEERLDEVQSSKYRAIVARCNYLSPDRQILHTALKNWPDIWLNPQEEIGHN